MSSQVVLQGDSLIVLKDLPDNSIDAIVTDPPYGLSFMGKKWDYAVPSVALWKEVLRVLKPGGHVLSFCGTRTYHRMVVNMEDAGFEIRDQIQWIYGSGFPKSLDISKAIDKSAGAEREVVGVDESRAKRLVNQLGEYSTDAGWSAGNRTAEITAPATGAAKQWQGWGTALKPANEPICLARKPLEPKLTVAANVLKHGTGGLNIDGTRIGTEQVESGRWPANVLFDEEAAAVLDKQVGKLAGGGPSSGRGFQDEYVGGKVQVNLPIQKIDKGGFPSRFFYVAKASKKDRGEGNGHPTVKPIKLMEYLIKLITPPGGTILDPFTGSGTTGVAAKNLGFDFIGIELDPEYVKIADKRIGAA